MDARLWLLTHPKCANIARVTAMMINPSSKIPPTKEGNAVGSDWSDTVTITAQA